jgi:hypothetical protein
MEVMVYLLDVLLAYFPSCDFPCAIRRARYLVHLPGKVFSRVLSRKSSLFTRVVPADGRAPASFADPIVLSLRCFAAAAAPNDSAKSALGLPVFGSTRSAKVLNSPRDRPNRLRGEQN